MLRLQEAFKSDRANVRRHLHSHGQRARAAESLRAHVQHRRPAGSGTDTDRDGKEKKGILPSQTLTCGNKL